MEDKLKDVNYDLKESNTEYYTEVYSPWETKEQLRLGREVRQLSWVHFSTVIQQNITTTTTIKITPWFNISSVNIRAYVNWSWNWSSDTIYSKSSWYAIWTSIAFTSTYPQWITDFNDNTQVLRLFQYNSSNVIRARIENITWTSFDLNFFEVDYSWYVTIIIECYS